MHFNHQGIRAGGLRYASKTQGSSDNSPEVWTTRYMYDTWGRLQQMTYPDGEVLTYAYDSGGLVRRARGVKLGVAFSEAFGL